VTSAVSLSLFAPEPLSIRYFIVLTYTAWAVLCDMVGLGRIWQSRDTAGNYASELPLTEHTINAAMTWWGALTKSERAGWLEKAEIDKTPTRAWVAYQQAARSVPHLD